jgi:hypothetical protein
MSTAKHTKGTWRQGGDGSAVFSGARIVASVYPMRDENAEELAANVCLIAAAPELLEALNKINDWACFASEEDISARLMALQQIGVHARAAIAKATGEQA